MLADLIDTELASVDAPPIDKPSFPPKTLSARPNAEPSEIAGSHLIDHRLHTTSPVAISIWGNNVFSLITSSFFLENQNIAILIDHGSD
jgi:hypothetical protein